MLTISYGSVEQLYFQNSKFGFYFLRLAAQRLLQNNVRLEDELARAQERWRGLPSTRSAEVG